MFSFIKFSFVLMSAILFNITVVGNVFADEWKIYGLMKFSHVNLLNGIANSVYKINLTKGSKEISWINPASGSDYCVRIFPIVSKIFIKEDDLILEFGGSNNSCNIARLVIPLNGSYGFKENYINGLWVLDQKESKINFTDVSNLNSFISYAKEYSHLIDDRSSLKLNSVKESTLNEISNVANNNILAEQLHLTEEAKLKEQQQLTLEAQQKEQLRLAQEAKQKEKERLQSEQKAKEQLRLVQEAKQKEQEKLLAEQKAKEQLRLAEDAKLKEQQRLALEAQQKEQLLRLAQEAKQKEQERVVSEQKA